MSHRLQQGLSERRFPTRNAPLECRQNYPQFSFDTSAVTHSETDCVSPSRTRRVTTVLVGVRYYGMRYYNPDLGRWINRDPIEERGGLNVYGFVGNASVCYIDKLGLAFQDLILDIVIGVVSDVWDRIRHRPIRYQAPTRYELDEDFVSDEKPTPTRTERRSGICVPGATDDYWIYMPGVAGKGGKVSGQWTRTGSLTGRQYKRIEVGGSGRSDHPYFAYSEAFEEFLVKAYVNDRCWCECTPSSLLFEYEWRCEINDVRWVSVERRAAIESGVTTIRTGPL